MKKTKWTPAIFISVIVIGGLLLLLNLADSYQQFARNEDGRSGLRTISEDRSFHRAVAVICIGQPLGNYKRKSSVY